MVALQASIDEILQVGSACVVSPLCCARYHGDTKMSLVLFPNSRRSHPDVGGRRYSIKHKEQGSECLKQSRGRG